MRLVLAVLSALGLFGATKVSLDLAALMAALGAFSVGAYNFWRVRQNRPLVGSEIEDRAVARMKTVMDEVTEDNERLREEVAQLRQRERELELEVRVCRRRIDHLGNLLHQHGIAVIE